MIIKEHQNQTDDDVYDLRKMVSSDSERPRVPSNKKKRLNGIQYLKTYTICLCWNQYEEKYATNF